MARSLNHDGHAFLSALLSRIISVFCAERVSFSSAHHSSITFVASCPVVSIWKRLFPVINTRRSSVYAIPRTPFRFRIRSKSSKTRFQRLSPRMEPCGYRASRFFHVFQGSLFALSGSRPLEHTAF